ncbi:MAG: S8 family peptidase [Desulfurococcaceae archaeon]
MTVACSKTPVSARPSRYISNALHNTNGVITMNRYIGPLIVVALIISLLTSGLPLSAQTPMTRVIVGLNDYDKGLNALITIGRLFLKIPGIKAVVVETPMIAIPYIARLPFVKYIEEDRQVIVFEEFQWNIDMINANDVWTTYYDLYGNAAYGYNPVIQVAIVDTGIDYAHRDLQGAVVYCIVSLRNEKTFYKGVNLKNCADQNGHGTHVAGIIGARLNGIGVAGDAPRVVIYAVKVLGASGSGYISDVAKGIVEAVKGPDGVPGNEDDADVISMSLGGPESPLLYSAVSYAYNYNVTLVAAAGNEGADNPSYLAAYPEVIAVGVVDSDYNVPQWSNRNPDVVAPGVNVLSTLPRNRYGYLSGTSMACPHVSASIALAQALRLASGKSLLTPQQIKGLLSQSAIDLGAQGYDKLYGYGLIDTYAFVNAVLNSP